MEGIGSKIENECYATFVFYYFGLGVCVFKCASRDRDEETGQPSKTPDSRWVGEMKRCLAQDG